MFLPVARLRHWFSCLACLVVLLPIGSHAADGAVVAIDVGHFKSHPGATSARGKPEFEFNRELAAVIQQATAAGHVNALRIGADGADIGLEDRTSQADKAGATFFLSVHHDSVQPRYLETWRWHGEAQHYSDRFSGFSLFVSRKNPQSGTSLTCARAIGTALVQAGFRPSSHHAEAIPGENREWADQEAGVYYFDDLVVLRTARMPAVLLEAGVIVNRADELALQQAATQRKLAAAVVHGLVDCGAAP